MHIHASRDITRDIYPEQKTFTPSETLVSDGTETQNSVLVHLIVILVRHGIMCGICVPD